MAKHAPPETRRRQILAAAGQCFADKGYYDTSIDDICAAAGLSKGAIYHHFPSKREIFLSLIASWSQELLARWQRSDDAAAGPLEAIVGESAEALSFLDEIEPMQRATLEFYAHAARDEEVQGRVGAVFEEIAGHIASLLEDAAGRGLIRPVAARPLADALVATFEGLVLLRLVNPALDISSAWREAVRTAVAGLAPEGAPVGEPA